MPDRLPDADFQEQSERAIPAGEQDPEHRVAMNAALPEPDVLEQATPAGPEAALRQPTFRREPDRYVPEADSQEQAMPADRELFDDDE